MANKQKIVLDKQIYEPLYESDIPNTQYYIDSYKKLPSTKHIFLSVTKDISEVFLKDGFKLILDFDSDNFKVEAKPNRTKYIKKLFQNDEKKMIITMYYYQYTENSFRVDLKILYDIDSGDISKQIDLTELNQYVYYKKTSNIKLIKNDNGYIDTEDFNLPTPLMDIELNYGSEFAKKHKIILESLNKNNNKGIVLLHGEAGTGKTTYIKYLASLIKDKSILFIPPSMADVLTEPAIIPFLIQNSNSILLIEDGEKVIADRESDPTYAAGVSNLLNMTDGILGDCLSIQVIVTFNMEREKIDNALLRNGRLISEHKFSSLSIENSNKLLKHLGKEYEAKKPMILADIYNVDSITFLEKKPKPTIGFKE